MNISNIYSAARYTIFSGSGNKYLYSSGHNGYGECCIGSFDEKNIYKYYQIDYFLKNNISIKKICVNVCGHCTFWIDDKNGVYGNGRNNSNRLGLGDTYHRNKPQLIEYFCGKYNILDIQTASNYSIALCKLKVDLFIKISFLWSNCNNLPIDIIVLIKIFYDNNINKVFVAGFNDYSGNAIKLNNKNKSNTPNSPNTPNNHNNNYQWKQLSIFRNRNIIKIRSGYEYSLFLQSNGNIWCVGRNSNGQLGLHHNKDINKPTRIKYFVLNKIAIWEIKCGGLHCLALDVDDNLYSWGYNFYGQLGFKSIDDDEEDEDDEHNVNKPVLVKYFKGINIIRIECGYHHSYCKTLKGKHYLFGSNSYNESTLIYDHRNKIKTPFCINGIIQTKCYQKKIKSISLGFENTKIILTKKSYKHKKGKKQKLPPTFYMTHYII